MYYGIYYITSKKHALKRFTGLLDSDLTVLVLLGKHNAPIPYAGLYSLLLGEDNGMSTRTFAALLVRGVSGGYISRTQIGGRAVYEITMEGRKLIASFAAELDLLVKDQVLKYGNGFDLY